MAALRPMTYSIGAGPWRGTTRTAVQPTASSAALQDGRVGVRPAGRPPWIIEQVGGLVQAHADQPGHHLALRAGQLIETGQGGRIRDGLQGAHHAGWPGALACFSVSSAPTAASASMAVSQRLSTVMTSSNDIGPPLVDVVHDFPCQE